MNAAKFATFEEFLLDLQLIWDNCKTYNMAGSDIYKLCERMEKMARRELQKWKSANGLASVVLPQSGATKVQQTQPPRAKRAAA